MQIQCHACRTQMAVSPYGGQFQCPICHAVNVVGTPIQPGAVAPHAYHQAQQVGAVGTAPPRANEKGSRNALLVVAVVGLGIGARFMQWWGIALGVALLAWTVAGALGKTKVPMAIVFRGSTRSVGLTALSFALSIFITTCGVLGTNADLAQRERAQGELEAKEKRAAVAAAEKERIAAERDAAVAALPQRIVDIDKAIAAADWTTAEAVWNEAYLLASDDIREQLEARRGPIENALQEIKRKEKEAAEKARKAEIEARFSTWASKAVEASQSPDACKSDRTLAELLTEFDEFRGADLPRETRGGVSEALRRLEKCRKAAAGRLAKAGRLAGVQARIALANKIERTFLDNRIDVVVRVKGKDKTTLWMQWIWNRVTIGDFEQGDTVAAIAEAGFEKIHYDSFMEYYTTSIDGVDWGEKSVSDGGLDRSFAFEK